MGIYPAINPYLEAAKYCATRKSKAKTAIDVKVWSEIENHLRILSK